MRIPAIFLPAALFASLALSGPMASGQTGQSDRKDVDIVASSDLKLLFSIHKQSQGGAERYDGIRTITFDYTPSKFDEKGKEIMASTRRISMTVRVNADNQELRCVRIDSKIEVPGEAAGSMVNIVSLVTEDGAVKVWSQAEDGSYIPVEAKELKMNAQFDALSMFSQLDLFLFLDTPDIRCTFTGALTRDSKRYVAIETSFRPGRGVAEPSRLYFDSKSSLIERIDVFHPDSNMRLSTTLVEDYTDHKGFKFPGRLRTLNRKGTPVGGWRMENVELNPKLSETHFAKP